jgi:glycosyltransferase involved in cell wall biosynthesis
MEPECNQYRVNFIKACESIEDIQFEGALIRKDDFIVPGYDYPKINSRYPLRVWLDKVKESMVGYVTHGVQGSLTPKLAEYLACGKAIICTPLKREMPVPLEHGEHVHFVHGSVESIVEAIRLIRGDDAYRAKLEWNARDYYLKYLQPEQVIRRILKRAYDVTGVKCF